MLASAVSLAISLALGAAAVAGTTPLRRAASVVLIALALLVPCLLPASWLFARTLFALATFVQAMRVIDLLSWTPPLRMRLLHTISAVDTRQCKRAPRSFDVRGLALALAWQGLAALAFVVDWARPFATDRPLFWAVRWTAALVVVYALIEGGYRVMRLAYAALGFSVPALHRHPILSLSIQELWGRRWAILVTTWMQATVFRPLARRGYPAVGVALAFTASALFHAYVVLVAIGAAPALVMFGYFVLQGALVMLERRLGIARLRRGLRRTWVVGAMVLTSPLFTEVILRIVLAPGWPFSS